MLLVSVCLLEEKIGQIFLSIALAIKTVCSKSKVLNELSFSAH